jgi:hypothetical protein
MKAAGAKMKEEKVWTFDEREVKDSVFQAIPENMSLRYFKVTSGDSGEEYETHLLYRGKGSIPPKLTIAWCKCQNGWYDRLPLLIVDLFRNTPILASDQLCKHAVRLIEFLRK